MIKMLPHALLMLLGYVLPLTASETPSPEVDDASLNSVFFTTATDGCAVGANGAIWVTRDGGEQWSFQKSPVAGLHECVTFVSAKVGWIVGSSSHPINQIPMGYVLKTEDGGETWKLIAGRATIDPQTGSHQILPRLRVVRFFTSKLGFAAGASNRFCPSGVLRTDDGGQTWRPVRGDSGSWRCAWFMNPETAFLGGRLNTEATLRGEQIVRVPGQLSDLRGWRAMKVTSTGVSWKVGDGAQVLASVDAGVSWQPPVRPLPKGLGHYTDFTTVASRGSKVWIAGSPGSVIWHSPDNGQKWIPQRTGQSTSLRHIFFRTDELGWAVGDLGVILRTENGGETWDPAKGAQRRVALLAMSSGVDRVPLDVVAKQSGELGYRSAVFLPVRRSIDPAEPNDGLDKSREAMAKVFGNVAEIGWQFPAAVSGIDRVDRQLLADWQIRTEGKLGQVLLASLVGKLRTLRPDVVVLDHDADQNAVARVMNKAMLRAVELAGDESQFVDQIQTAGLRPWLVRRVYRRVAEGARGQIEVSGQEVLLLRGNTVGAIAEPAFRQIADKGLWSRSAYRRVYPPLTEGQARGDFFRGLGISPGSDSRRPTLQLTEDKSEFLAEVANRERNISGYMERFLTTDQRADQLIAQLGELTSDLPPAVASRQLRAIADRYAKAQRWTLVAAVMRDIVTRYPQVAEASAAREWLMSWWGAAEPTWQRLRVAKVGGDIQLAGAELDSVPGILRRPSEELIPKSFSPTEVQDAQKSSRSSMADNWRASALEMSQQLRQFDPLKFESGAMQLRIASLMRMRDNRAGAMSIYGKRDLEGYWQRLAKNEIWLDQQAAQPPNSTVKLRRAIVPPELDGILSDECWQAAKEMWLKGNDLDESRGSFTAMSFDDEYVYLAGAIRRHESTADVKTHRGRREYDADFGTHDRIVWRIDIDRDYATWYELQIDQRGMTRDKCWLDQHWNPKWFVAVVNDQTHWRFEVAIPIHELASRPPMPGNAWAIGVSRSLPGFGSSDWGEVASQFGLAMFGR